MEKHHDSADPEFSNDADPEDNEETPEDDPMDGESAEDGAPEETAGIPDEISSAPEETAPIRHLENKWVANEEQDVKHLADAGPAALESQKLHWRSLLSAELAALVDQANASAPDHRSYDFYHGSIGIAYLFLHLHYLDSGIQVRHKSVLDWSRHFAESAVRGCELYVEEMKRLGVNRLECGIIQGEVSVWAIASIVYHTLGDESTTKVFLDRLVGLQDRCLKPTAPQELFYGRPGYLHALLLVRRFLRERASTHITDDLIEAIFDQIIQDGQKGSQRKFTKPADRNAVSYMSTCGSPLVFSWYLERYIGAAHGLAGVLAVLMDCPDLASSDENESCLLGALEFLKSRKVTNGNYTVRVDETLHNSPQLAESVELVQFCHGAAGVGLCFAKAYELLMDDSYLAEAKGASDVVWHRGLLRKGVSLCHGISGNAMLFLTLLRITNDIRFWYRATKFASAALEHPSETSTHGGLMEGRAGLVWLLSELAYWNFDQDATDATQAPVRGGFPGFTD
ncbi:uncharacterized protein BJ171DRAFT_484820 [Polychytrium aggregatum]|uniref:uncharacterized protein n=1 Tax=Polychytrium aggregatum TaxID=110093 RepID=UPI0022FE8CCF|nr:uncharacterized protein BJ171DRAFT_484820 [Polychytrium aggregatum]KAI9209707.1 hypothetical protein BJ171DRAFT_484820 [Polychytrium aggregatum]